MRLLRLSLLALLLTAAPASAQVLESPDRATPIDVDRGTVLFSQRGQDGKFRLAVHPAAGARYTLDVPPQSEAFDADLGTDASGQAVAVYESCPASPLACDIRIHHLTTGEDAPVPAAARPGVDEHAPTIARGRLVWATVVDMKPKPGVITGRPRVLTQMLGSSARPGELPGLPARRCFEHYDRGRVCARPSGRVVEQELDGDRLAQSVVASTDGIMRNVEMRLVGVRRETSLQVASFGAGESGQSLIGPSFDRGRLHWYFACFGDPSGCNRAGGTYRFAPGSGRIERSVDGRQLSGFGVDGGKAYVSEGDEMKRCELEQSYVSADPATIGPCPISARPLPTRWSAYTQRRG